MRIESSVTSLSWIPPGAVEGSTACRLGSASPTSIRHHPRSSATVTSWPPATGSGSPTGSRPGSRCGTAASWTPARAAAAASTSPKWATARPASRSPVVLPDLRPEPEIGPGWARFVQTTGGQTGFPTPRRVRHKPYVQIGGPVTWSTLALTIYADGRSEPRLVGASSFPRHWIYDHTGRLIAKSGFIDHDTWWREAFGSHTPWGRRTRPRS